MAHEGVSASVPNLQLGLFSLPVKCVREAADGRLAFHSLRHVAQSAQEVCAGRAGDLLEHGAGELPDLGWQGHVAVGGGVGLAVVGEPLQRLSHSSIHR